MPAKTLLVVPSSSGNPVAIASLFAVRGFTHIALVGSDAKLLDSDEDAVLDAIQERGYSCQTKTYPSDDISSGDGLERFLKDSKIDDFGDMECVLYHDQSDEQSPEVFEGLLKWASKFQGDTGRQGSLKILIATEASRSEPYRNYSRDGKDGIRVAWLEVSSTATDTTIAQKAWDIYRNNEADAWAVKGVA